MLLCCFSEVCVTLVDVSVLLIISETNCPLCLSVYGCEKVECAFTSHVSIESGMMATCCVQCVMSVSLQLLLIACVFHSCLFTSVHVVHGLSKSFVRVLVRLTSHV